MIFRPSGYMPGMNLTRILLIVAVASFLIAAVSAFSDNVNVNEGGFLALGLAAWAGSYLVVASPVPVARPRAFAGRRPAWRDDPYD